MLRLSQGKSISSYQCCWRVFMMIYSVNVYLPYDGVSVCLTCHKNSSLSDLLVNELLNSLIPDIFAYSPLTSTVSVLSIIPSAPQSSSSIFFSSSYLYVVIFFRSATPSTSQSNSSYSFVTLPSPSYSYDQPCLPFLLMICPPMSLPSLSYLVLHANCDVKFQSPCTSTSRYSFFSTILPLSSYL